MTRYFFHIEDDIAEQDEEGVELETLTDAKCMAVRLAGQMICDSASRFWDTEDWKLTATDETGLTLFRLIFFGIDGPVLQAEAVSPPFTR